MCYKLVTLDIPTVDIINIVIQAIIVTNKYYSTFFLVPK